MKRAVASPGIILLWVLVFGLLFAGLTGVRTRMDEARDLEEAESELLYLPDWQVLHVVLLAEDGVAADALWLRGVFYLAAQDFEEKQLSAMGLDPERYHHNHYALGHAEHCEACDILMEKAKDDMLQTPPGFDTLTFAEIDFRQHPIIRKMLLWNLGSDDAREFYRLLDNVTTLDSLFLAPYTQGALSLAIMAGRPEEALKILDKGGQACPDSWEIPYFKGFIKLFYLNDKSGAADDIGMAASKPGVLPIVVDLAAALRAKLGDEAMAFDFLRALSETTNDIAMKRYVDQLLDAYSQIGRNTLTH